MAKCGRITVEIFKAQETSRGSPVPSVTIKLRDPIPELGSSAASNTNDLLALYDKQFMDQAKALEEALYKALPGGTYDRLCGLMLQRKAGHFIVSHEA